MRNRCVTFQPLVGPGHMIILVDERMWEPFQMTLAQYDHMVTELSPQRSDESLHERILPRASIGSPDFLYATAVQKRSYTVAVEAVIVAEEVRGL